MANELCTSLGLVGKDLSGKLIHVAEDHGSDTSFVVGSLVWNASRSGASVCMLALHHSKAHYKKVAKRLGYNLNSVPVLDPFLEYVEGTGRFGDLDMSNDDNLKRLYFDLKRTVAGVSGTKWLVVDDLSGLLSLGASPAQVVAFLQYCRVLMDGEHTLVLGTHHSPHCEDQQLVYNFVAHVADCRLAVAPLKTGFSSDVTGTIHVDSRLFHYKLTDKDVKVFAPGSVGIRL